MKMKRPSGNASLFALALLLTTVARADVLTPIRAAADHGVCVVEHQGAQESAIAIAASAYDLVGIDQREVVALIERFLGARVFHS